MPKPDKSYEEFNIDLSLTDNSRETLRKRIVNIFLEEKGGYWQNGIKHVTRYKYFVEKLVDGRRIFLYRPTHLNKGIDFQVWVEQFRDNKDERPSHKDVFEDLRKKHANKPELYPRLLEAIELVWKCDEPDRVIQRYKNLDFGVGFSVELILKILKWLFIEQDITYWNYDGRTMLWQGIKNIINTRE